MSTETLDRFEDDRGIKLGLATLAIVANEGHAPAVLNPAYEAERQRRMYVASLGGYAALRVPAQEVSFREGPENYLG